MPPNSQPAKPTHGGTAASQTLPAIRKKMKEPEDKISKEEIEKGIEFLKKEFKYFNDKNLHFDEDEEETVYIEYPGDDEAYGLKFNDFDFLTYELSKFKIINEGRFHTTWSSYQIVRFENEDIQYYLWFLDKSRGLSRSD